MGNRGEGWFLIQAILLVLILIAPFAPEVTNLDLSPLLRAAGAAAMLLGGVLVVAGIFGLGPSVSPFPKPREDGALTTRGPYALVRHPIYTGIILGSFGWGILTASGLTLLLALVLFFFFDAKSRREEAWLSEKYPGYVAYQQRVKKLIPWVY